MHLQIRHICVPTDFSPAADHAVHYGAALAHQHGADLHLLHALEEASVLVHHSDFSADGEIGRAYFRKLEEDAVDGAEAHEPPDPKHATHQFLKSLETGASQQLEAGDAIGGRVSACVESFGSDTPLSRSVIMPTRTPSI